MAASYAIPAIVHDADHLHSHSGQHVTQRLPIEVGPTKGMNGGPRTQEDNTTSTPSHNHSSHTFNRQIVIDNEHLDSTTQLPPPRFTSVKAGNSRPKNMQRRISVGLPTHLRLQGKGYGVPAARKPSFAPTGDPASR